jgi:hypothetical protein
MEPLALAALVHTEHIGVLHGATRAGQDERTFGLGLARVPPFFTRERAAYLADAASTLFVAAHAKPRSLKACTQAAHSGQSCHGLNQPWAGQPDSSRSACAVAS